MEVPPRTRRIIRPRRGSTMSGLSDRAGSSDSCLEPVMCVRDMHSDRATEERQTSPVCTLCSVLE